MHRTPRFMLLVALLAGCGSDPVTPRDGAGDQVSDGGTDQGTPDGQVSDGGAEQVSDADAASDGGDAPAGIAPRLVTVSRDGHIASLDVAAPWTVRASGALG